MVKYSFTSVEDIIHWDRQYDFKSSENWLKIYWNGRQLQAMGEHDSVLLAQENEIYQCDYSAAVYSALGKQLVLKNVLYEDSNGSTEHFKRVKLTHANGNNPLRFRLNSLQHDNENVGCESVNVFQDKMLYIPEVLVNDQFHNPKKLRNLYMKSINQEGEYEFILTPN